MPKSLGRGYASPNPNKKLFLIILNWTAKLVPPLAQWIEEFEKMLLQYFETPEELIAQAAREANKHAIADGQNSKGKEALSSTPSPIEPTTSQPDLLRGEGSEKVPEPLLPPKTITQQASLELAAQEAFLRRSQEMFERSQVKLTNTIERGERRAETAMRLRVSGIIFTFLLIAIGAYLALFRESGVLGTLSSLVGLMAGGGTLMLKELEKTILTKIASDEVKAERIETFLQSIQVALSMSGSNREAYLKETADWLKKQASASKK
ncbi:hypothetical protein [Pleomorphovibrio marinus]|uniref:hypothetical protein n=1 Tax=Pleomorphovibrio marinus TaxID=2164132 RepID=UPI0013005E54|nr:hypothetical protein [Pleomorphovibrio marinus]